MLLPATAMDDKVNKRQIKKRFNFTKMVKLKTI